MAGLCSKAIFLASLALPFISGCESSVQAQVAALQKQNNKLQNDLADARRRLAEVESRLQQSQAEPTQNDLTTLGLSWSNANPHPTQSIDLFRFPPAYDFGGSMTNPTKVAAPTVWAAPVELKSEPPSLPPNWFPIGVLDVHNYGQDLIDEHPNRRP